MHGKLHCLSCVKAVRIGQAERLLDGRCLAEATIDQSSSSPADSPPSPAPPEEAVAAPEDDGEMHTMPVYEEPGPPQPAPEPLPVEQAEL